MTEETRGMGSFERYGSVMIDLETLSTNTDASIIEIGAVEFSERTGDTGGVFNVIVDPSEWGQNGRHVDGKTLQWWLSQPDAARMRFAQDAAGTETMTLRDALSSLSRFIEGCDSDDADLNVKVWGNGSTMDITALSSAYEHFGMEKPWKFWAVRDVRTVVDLNPSLKKDTPFTHGIQHSAVSDCKHQIKYLTRILRSVRLI